MTTGRPGGLWHRGQDRDRQRQSTAAHIIEVCGSAIIRRLQHLLRELHGRHGAARSGSAQHGSSSSPRSRRTSSSEVPYSCMRRLAHIAERSGGRMAPSTENRDMPGTAICSKVSKPTAIAMSAAPPATVRYASRSVLPSRSPMRVPRARREHRKAPLLGVAHSGHHRGVDVPHVDRAHIRIRERGPASVRAYRPARYTNSRRDSPRFAPNGLIPTPTTATSRIFASSLKQADRAGPTHHSTTWTLRQHRRLLHQPLTTSLKGMSLSNLGSPGRTRHRSRLRRDLVGSSGDSHCGLPSRESCQIRDPRRRRDAAPRLRPRRRAPHRRRASRDGRRRACR